MTNQKTAILIFANSAERDGVLKPFRKSVSLFAELNHQTVEKVKRSGLPYFHFSEKEQTGATFGERYTNAIQFVYDQGFDNIITIGNDTPHLQTSQILETANKLKANPIVLGPSLDGGFYLLGLNKAHFNANTFLKLPWQTSSLTKSIERLLSVKKIEVLFLDILSDIDSVSDIKKVIESFRSLGLKLLKILLHIISSEINLFRSIYLYYSSLLKETLFNKGSPVFTS